MLCFVRQHFVFPFSFLGVATLSSEFKSPQSSTSCVCLTATLIPVNLVYLFIFIYNSIVERGEIWTLTVSIWNPRRCQLFELQGSWQLIWFFWREINCTLDPIGINVIFFFFLDKAVSFMKELKISTKPGTVGLNILYWDWVGEKKLQTARVILFLL